MAIRVIESASPTSGRIKVLEPAQKPARTKAREAARKRVRGSQPAQVRALTQGATLGFSDEIDAAGAALETGANNLLRKVTGRESVGYGMRDAYDAVMAEEKEANAEFAREHPVQNILLQIGGGIATPGAAAAGRFVGGARGLGGAVARSALVGAGYGGVAGAGASDGSLENRAKGAGRGAVVGGAIGGATPVVVRAAQTAGRAVDNATGGRIGTLFGGHEGRAVQRIRDALRADGVDDATINRVTQEWVDTGAPPPMLMNVAGENTRKLVRLAGMKGGDAANTLGGIGRRTRANMPAQARARARELTPGETRPANVLVEAANEAREKAANRNYAGPYRTQVKIGDDVANVLTDAPGKAALRSARADALERRAMGQVDEIDNLLRAEPIPTDPFEWYTPTPERVSGSVLDRTQIAMRERGNKLSRAGNNARAGGSFGRRAVIDSTLEQVPELQGARGNYKAFSQFAEGAEDVGPNVLKQASDEFAPQFEAMGPTDVNPLREGARVGARQTLTDAFGQTPRKARGVLDAVADAEDPQRNLRALFGDQADRFVEAIRRIRQSVDDATFVDPNAGSKTAPSQADAEAANDFVQLLKGNGFGVLIQKLQRGLTLTEQEAAIIAEIATSLPTKAAQRLRPNPAQSGVNVLSSTAARTPAMVAGRTQGQREPVAEAYLVDDPEVYGAAYR